MAAAKKCVMAGISRVKAETALRGMTKRKDVYLFS
jgi:hypothetical protein